MSGEKERQNRLLQARARTDILLSHQRDDLDGRPNRIRRLRAPAASQSVTLGRRDVAALSPPLKLCDRGRPFARREKLPNFFEKFLVGTGLQAFWHLFILHLRANHVQIALPSD